MVNATIPNLSITTLREEMTKSIPPREFAAKFQFFAQEAEREPVLIGAGSDDPLVVITLREYHRLLELDRKVYATHDLPEHLVQAIHDAKPSAESERFNDEWDEPVR